MKTKLVAAAIMVLLLNGCNKTEYNAHLRFDVSDEFETKAIINGLTESGIDIIWEEGDEISLDVNTYMDEMPKPLNTVEGKLVYQDGKWKTYQAKGSSFVEKESISISSPFLNSKVRIRFSCINDTFVAAWVRTIPFSEGVQTILVTLPFET